MSGNFESFLNEYGSEEDKSVEEDDEQSEDGIFVPKTVDEWLQKLGFDGIWPVKIEEEKSMNLSPEDAGTGSLEDIINMLAAHAPLNLNVFDEALQQVEELEKKVYFYASKFLDVEVTAALESEVNETEETEDEARIDTPPLVRLYRNAEESIFESTKKCKEIDALNRKLKCVENASYYGFIPSELTPLPGNLESKQLLNRVTKILNIPQPFKNVWKKVILSEASVAVFQDTFWWIFCNNFEPCQSTDMIFSRISDSFVALFFTVPTAYKDQFFLHYPNCLAQALYAGFCEAFPDSYKVFGHPFKTMLTDTVYEWISGVRAPPALWETWELDKLEPSGFQKGEEARKSLIPRALSFDIDTVLADDRVSPSGESKPKSRLQFGQVCKEQFKSHPVGGGPSFTKVQFNILGNSPLVSHFMQSKGLRQAKLDTVQKVVKRTEIDTLPEPKPTYQDLIDECKKNSQLLRQQYRLVIQMSAEESQRIQQQKRAVITKINDIQNELTRKQSDLKTLGEKIYDIVLHPEYA